jgi:hypothetical protein
MDEPRPPAGGADAYEGGVQMVTPPETSITAPLM